MLLNCLPLENNQRRENTAPYADILYDNRPSTRSRLFFLDRAVTTVSNNKSVSPLAFHYTSFVHIVSILGADYQDYWNPEMVEPRLDYSRCSRGDSLRIDFPNSLSLQDRIPAYKTDHLLNSESLGVPLLVEDSRSKAPDLAVRR